MVSLLDSAVDCVARWGSDRRSDRDRCLELLGETATRMQRAIAVWNAFLECAPESGDRFTAVLWMGADRAKELQSIHLENSETAKALSALTGVRFKDSLSLAEDLDVVLPYEQLGPGETGGDRARAAIGTMTARKERIESAIRSLRGE